MADLIYSVLRDLLLQYPIITVFLPSVWLVDDTSDPPSLEFKHYFVGRVGKKWLEGKSRSTLMLTLSHLSAHVICQHYLRGVYMYKDDELWDIACDYDANHFLYQLDKSSFGGLKPFRKRWVGKSVEEIYLLLVKGKGSLKRAMDKHNWVKGAGTLNPSQIVKNSYGYQYLSKKDLQRVLNAVSSLVNESLNPLNVLSDIVNNRSDDKKAGETAGDTVVELSKLDVFPIASKAFHYIVANTTVKRGYLPPEIDFLFLWQRRIAEILLPYSLRLLVVCVDTSSSIRDDMLPLVASFVTTLFVEVRRLYPYCGFIVVMVDAAVQDWWDSRFSDIDIFRFISLIKGRGGTKIFTSLQNFVSSLSEMPDAILIISDFETMDNEGAFKYSQVPLFGIIINESKNYREDEKLMQLMSRFSKVKFVGVLNVG